MNELLAKDITFNVTYHSYEYSKVVVYYGDKSIMTVAIPDDSVTEFKAVCHALQAEILKDFFNNRKPQ